MMCMVGEHQCTGADIEKEDCTAAGQTRDMESRGGGGGGFCTLQARHSKRGGGGGGGVLPSGRGGGGNVYEMGRGGGGGGCNPTPLYLPMVYCAPPQ